MQPTFQKQRTCRHCGAPIADEAHAATQFCVKETHPNGSIKSCKDDYYSARRTQNEKPYRELISFHKRMTDALESLLKAKGAVVSLDELNLWGVDLSRAVRLTLEGNEPCFSFLFHRVQGQPDGTFQITPYVHLY